MKIRSEEARMAKKLAFDAVLFTTVLVLVGFGLTAVYSASAATAKNFQGSESALMMKQVFAAAIGIVAMWLLMHFDYQLFGRKTVVWSLFGATVGLLVLALVSPALNNTNRWLMVAGMSFQPSELAKFVLVLLLAYQLAKTDTLRENRRFVVPAILTAGALVVLVLLGRDLGTAAMLIATTALMFFLAGLPLWRILAAGALVGPLVAAAIYFEPYRRARWLAFLDPAADPLGSGFQALQSLIAVGSGGVFGLGLGQGIQKLHFLPYPHSDFVFSIVAEELGLLGGLVLLTLFGALLWRGARAGRRAPDALGRYLAWGLTGALSIQAAVHISVALALLPATGINLPFVSYGGSSLVVSLAACGVILNVSQHA
ncbi:MAG: cell division protein FtsW [bacterium]|nr:cell division protein FtsW [bacterium]